MGKPPCERLTFGLVGQLLKVMVPGQAIKEPPPPKPDTGYRTYSFSNPLDWIT
jgi:hypothetical protein